MSNRPRLSILEIPVDRPRHLHRGPLSVAPNYTRAVQRHCGRSRGVSKSAKVALGRGISCRRNLPVGFIHLPASIARTAHGCGQRQHNARNSIRRRGSFKATEASLTIAADQADSMPVSPSSPCSGIHNRLHGPLHRLVVDRIDVGELVRDRLQELRALARSQQRRGAAD